MNVKKVLIVVILGNMCVPYNILPLWPFDSTLKIDFNINPDETESVVEKMIKGSLKAFEAIAINPQTGNLFTESFKGFTGNGLQAISETFENPEIKQQMSQATEAATTTAIQEILPHVKKLNREVISTFFNIENAVRIGTPIALAIALPVAGYFGSKIAFRALEKQLLDPRPDIVLPGSKFGRWDRIKRWKEGYKTPPMIFDQSVKERLLEIQNTTTNIQKHISSGKKATYSNLLLYGKPGTGKTLFAQILADETNMDFLPVTAASLLQSGVKGVQYFNDLLAMANKSKYGVIIFVDEADALFVDRNTLNPESDHYKVLNHILALTGSGSDKFMLVAATNHAYLLDEAMGRRFQDRVLMPLPDLSTRIALIDLYNQSVLFNEKENGAAFVKTAQLLFNPQTLKDAADKTDGLSHAEIKDMIVAIRKKAFGSQDGMITRKHITDAVYQAIEKHQAFDADREQQKERLMQKHE